MYFLIIYDNWAILWHARHMPPVTVPGQAEWHTASASTTLLQRGCTSTAVPSRSSAGRSRGADNSATGTSRAEEAVDLKRKRSLATCPHVSEKMPHGGLRSWRQSESVSRKTRRPCRSGKSWLSSHQPSPPKMIVAAFATVGPEAKGRSWGMSHRTHS